MQIESNAAAAVYSVGANGKQTVSAFTTIDIDQKLAEKELRYFTRRELVLRCFAA